MMWFTADLHLGDTNILRDMDRPFDSVEEMNRKVIDAINECVAADDRLYILGDFTYRLPLAEAVRLRERIECKNVTLIRGNHDSDWEDSDVPHILGRRARLPGDCSGYAKGHRLVMSHYPMLSWDGARRVAPSCCTGIFTAGGTAPTRATAIASAPFTATMSARRQRVQARKPRSNPWLLLDCLLEPPQRIGTFVVVLALLPLWRRCLFCPCGAVEYKRLKFSSIEELL